jgi:hypothetical protein
VLTVIVLTLAAANARAQQAPAAAAPPSSATAQSAPSAVLKPPVVPLKVQVTIVRLQKEVVTSRAPFTLWVNANDDRTTLNLGSSVPLPNGNYQSVGTTISCGANTTSDNLFRLVLNVSDSSVVPGKDNGLPIIQSLTSNNTLVVRNGQSVEFLSTTDKITGEVTRIDVVATLR